MTAIKPHRVRPAYKLDGADAEDLVRQAHSAVTAALAQDPASEVIALPLQDLLLPRAVLGLMADMLHLLASGSKVQLAPVDAEMTTGQAAEHLGISRPTLVKLLEDGLIPFHRAGERRRVLSAHVYAYKAQRDGMAPPQTGEDEA